MKTLIAVCVTALLASTAIAQQNPIGAGNAPFAPNQYNRNSQPLSPYLNLLRGGNPAVNYFYGVQPGTTNGAFRNPLVGNSQTMGRQTFFPQVDNLYELENVSPLDGLKPTGHPVGFVNTLNYFGAGSVSPTAQRGQQQQRATIAAPSKSGGR